MNNTMEAKTIDVLGGTMSYLSIGIDLDRETILFIHGLGESNLSFLEAFQEPMLQSYNLIAPDLLGFGRSSDATEGGYSLSAQATRLIQLLEKLGIEKCHLVGHSMGGDIGVMLCHRKPDLFSAFVNIEGDLTSGDRFITEQAKKHIEQEELPDWIATDFRDLVLTWAKKWHSCYRYLVSLSFCRLEAFSESALEIYALNGQESDGESTIGKRYCILEIPKIYCWGEDSLSPESKQYLLAKRLSNQLFENSGHWVMQDRREAFYNFLAGFLAGHRVAVN